MSEHVTPNNNGVGKVCYATGAERSSCGEEVRFDLVSPIALSWLAATASEDNPSVDRAQGLSLPASLASYALEHINGFLAGGDPDNPSSAWIRKLSIAGLALLRAIHIERGGADVEYDADHNESDDLLLRFDLLPPRGMLAVAEVYHEGASKHGRMNWELGFGAHDCLNRACRHLWLYLDDDDSEPHLPHAAWNVFGAIHSIVMWPDLNRGMFRKPGCLHPSLSSDASLVSLVDQVTAMMTEVNGAGSPL